MKCQKPRFVVVGRLLLLLVRSRLHASSLVTVNHPSEVNKTVPIARRLCQHWGKTTTEKKKKKPRTHINPRKLQWDNKNRSVMVYLLSSTVKHWGNNTYLCQTGYCCLNASDMLHSWSFRIIRVQVIRACLTLLEIIGLNPCQEPAPHASATIPECSSLAVFHR